MRLDASLSNFGNHWDEFEFWPRSASRCTLLGPEHTVTSRAAGAIQGPSLRRDRAQVNLGTRSSAAVGTALVWGRHVTWGTAISSPCGFGGSWHGCAGRSCQYVPFHP